MATARNHQSQDALAALDKLDLSSVTVEDLRKMKNEVLKSAVGHVFGFAPERGARAIHTNQSIVIHASHGQHI